jgi:hypothetical protein
VLEPNDQTTWNAESKRVSRAYDDWRLAEQGLRAFLRVGLEFAEEGYDSRWQRLSAMPSDGEGPELIDLMDNEVDGLTQIDYDWLLLNLVLRDGATLYEVYLEKVLHEVVSMKVHGTTFGEKSPIWPQIRKVYKEAFGLPVDPPDVKAVVDLRNLLTHRRGELLTETLRAQYDTNRDGLPDVWVDLKADGVTNHLDTLAAQVDRIDAVMYPIAWGEAPVEHDLHDMLLLSAPWLFEG